MADTPTQEETNALEEEQRILNDERDARAQEFWRRILTHDWPHDSTGFVFLGRAVHRIGHAKFGGIWSMNVPMTRFSPIMDPLKHYVGNGWDGVYALAILAAYAASQDAENVTDEQVDAARAILKDPIDLFTKFRRAGRTRWKTDVPLDKWLEACALHRRHVSVMDQHHRGMFEFVAKGITEAIAQDRLKAGTMTRDGVFRASPSSEWRTDLAFRRFYECQMNPDRPYFEMVPHVGDLLAGTQFGRLMPNNAWIFVTEESLDGVLKAMNAAKPARQTQAGRAGDDHLREIRNFIYATVRENGWFPLKATTVVKLIEGVSKNSTKRQRKTIVAESQPEDWPVGGGNYPEKERSERATQIKELRQQLNQEFAQQSGQETRH